jgi:transcriptional adapter 2-alpha
MVVRIRCAICEEIDICLECFSTGQETEKHKSEHDYRVIDTQQYPVYVDDWSYEEEQLLLEGLQVLGMGNWIGVASYIGSKTPDECKEHYIKVYIESANYPLPDAKLKSVLKEAKHAKHLTKEGVKCPTLEAKVLKEAQERHTKFQKISSHPSNHEISGYMPKRREFDVEFENEAEMPVKEFIFHEEDAPSEVESKLTMLEIYNAKRKGALHAASIITKSLFAC